MRSIKKKMIWGSRQNLEHFNLNSVDQSHVLMVKTFRDYLVVDVIEGFENFFFFFLVED